MSCTSDYDRDKWETRPLGKEGASYRQNCKFLTVTKIWSLAPDGTWHQDWLADWLSVVMWLWLSKILIRSVMFYACPAWEFAADTHLLKLQRLRNKVFRIIGNFPRCTPVRDLHTAFNLPYVYYNRIVQASSRGHTKSWERTCSQRRTRRSQTQKIQKT
jgi:hypothetical protein